MKKQLLALALLGAGLTNAQTWSENFSSTTAPNLPALWTQNNVDGSTVVSNLSSYNFGTNAWVTRDMSTFSGFGPYGRCAISTSWYTPAGASNDWMISPSFTVPPNAVLNWEARCSSSSFADGYSLKISTTGTAVADFNANPNLFSVSAENVSWTQRGVSLNTYSNQTVYLAWVNASNDKELLFVDNISVSVPPSTDGNVVSIAGLSRYMAGAGTQNIGGLFKHVGFSTATTAVMNYNVNGGSVTTQTMNFNLGYGQQSNYSFTTPASLSLGANLVKVWVTEVNGTPESNLVNDTAWAMVYVASQSVTINALIEEWTSSTCGPCASLNSSFDPLLATNSVNIAGSGVNAIKYQVNWPSPGNDPSYNPHSATKVTHYGINAAPTVKGNGGSMGTNQSGINAAKAQPGFATITASLTLNGSALTASSTITPFVNIPTGSPIRVNQAILQRHYSYPGASTSQKEYHHVMRKMFPNGWGTPVAVGDGVPQNASFSHTITTVTTPAQGSYDFWTDASPAYEYVVWLQDTVNNQILQSASAVAEGISTGIVKFENNSQIGVYPNPAKDYAVVGIQLNNPATVNIAIYDMSGKMVYENKGASLLEGTREIKINTSEFASGTYNIVVKADENTLREKLIIVK